MKKLTVSLSYVQQVDMAISDNRHIKNSIEPLTSTKWLVREDIEDELIELLESAGIPSNEYELTSNK